MTDGKSDVTTAAGVKAEQVSTKPPISSLGTVFHLNYIPTNKPFNNFVLDVGGVHKVSRLERHFLVK